MNTGVIEHCLTYNHFIDISNVEVVEIKQNNNITNEQKTRCIIFVNSYCLLTIVYLLFNY